jgi:cell division protein FtsL
MSSQARIVKRRLKPEVICAMILLIALILNIASSLFLRAYNVQLSVSYQDMNTTVDAMLSNNAYLKSETDALSDYSRIAAIAKEHGLSLSYGNLLPLNTGE